MSEYKGRLPCSKFQILARAWATSWLWSTHVTKTVFSETETHWVHGLLPVIFCNSSSKISGCCSIHTSRNWQIVDKWVNQDIRCNSHLHQGYLVWGQPGHTGTLTTSHLLVGLPQVLQQLLTDPCVVTNCFVIDIFQEHHTSRDRSQFTHHNTQTDIMLLMHLPTCALIGQTE